jgi:RHS repeat-associated protein
LGRGELLMEPFGTQSPRSFDANAATQGPFRFNLRFPGQYYDSETALHYNIKRYYDPSTGRYLQADPIGLGGGLNRYAYVGGDPVNFADPLGLEYGGGFNDFSDICFDFATFANEIEENRTSHAANLAALFAAGAIGSMPKIPEEMRALGGRPNPYTSQLSRLSSRLGIRELREFGRTTLGIGLSGTATAALVVDGAINWGVILGAAASATSGGSCTCLK